MSATELQTAKKRSLLNTGRWSIGVLACGVLGALPFGPFEPWVGPWLGGGTIFAFGLWLFGGVVAIGGIAESVSRKEWRGLALIVVTIALLWSASKVWFGGPLNLAQWKRKFESCSPERAEAQRWFSTLPQDADGRLFEEAP